MVITRISFFAVSAFLMLSASSCTHDPQGDISKAIRDCASSDAVGVGQIIYTGPVGVGPGSRWIRLNADLLRIAADARNIFGAIPTSPDFMAPPPGTGTNCDMARNTKRSLGADLGVSVATLPISANLKTKIGNSAKVSVSVEGFEWQDVMVDVYNGLIDSLPDASPYKRPGPGRLTAISMLRVKGYEATVDFNANTDLGLGVGYKGPLPANLVGEVKTSVTATVTDDGKLVIKVPGESYIAGIFRPVNGASGRTESSSTTVAGKNNQWIVKTSDIQGGRGLR
jgi:hypothetical protein